MVYASLIEALPLVHHVISAVWSLRILHGLLLAVHHQVALEQCHPV